ncbi:MAG TPA: ABC transporter ATP-binding protein [Methylomirabilota bacterium]|jgi:branched-chain amino acid transport system ATP-binding protein|nr:ABC transporter ATP-binding protein [Methylomirabilota bacterium]
MLRALMLEVAGLRVAHGDVQALWGVDFEVPAGRIVTLLGANGAGKTTTLRAVSGLIRPESGTIRFEGRDVTGLAPHAIVGLGLSHIPEGRRLWAGMTVRETLELGAYPTRARAGLRASFEWVCGLFPRLAERQGQLAGTLSGGEQQMLAIGRALMARPRLLMLDEPSLGLAPLLVAELFETIVRINRDGVTMLLVEQNVHQALRIAHSGYVLETGRIALTGSAQALLDDPYIKEAYLGL